MRNEERFNVSLGLAAGLLALSGVSVFTIMPATTTADSGQEPRRAVERAFEVVEESGVLQLSRPDPLAGEELAIQGERVVRHATPLPGGKAQDRLADELAAVDDTQRDEIRAAVETFVWGLSNGVANAVWALAPEMDQDRLGTQQALMEYLAEGNPQMRHAERMVFDGVTWQDGLPVARFYVIDRLGMQWHASFGLYRNVSGEWKIISTEIEPAPGDLI